MSRAVAGDQGKRTRDAVVRHPGSLSRSGRLSDLSLRMPLSPICSILEGIWSERNNIEISGSVRSMNGAGRLLESPGQIRAVCKT